MNQRCSSRSFRLIVTRNKSTCVIEFQRKKERILTGKFRKEFTEEITFMWPSGTE